MAPRMVICALLVLVLIGGSFAQSDDNLFHNTSTGGGGGATSVPDRYVALFASDADCREAYEDFKANYTAGTLGDNYPINMTFNTNNINVFEVVIYDPTDDQISRVEKIPCANVTQDTMSMHIVSPGSETPLTWGVDRIDQRNLPLDDLYSWDNNGSGSVVFVIDTGVNVNHPDWAAGQAVFGADCVTATCLTANDPGDPHGHGTHVAGSSASPSYGVAKGATIISVRVLDASGSGSWAGVVAGIVWATNYATNHPDKRYVINMSIGGDPSQSVDQAVDDATAAGVVVVVAAGNEGTDACMSSPAGAPTAVTVGASGNTDFVASWSNWGACVDIFAPGVDILSLSADGTTTTMSGTSMASPHVAGAVAQILELHPLMTVAEAVIELQCDATVAALTEPVYAVNLLLYNDEFDVLDPSCPATLPPFPEPPFSDCTGFIGWIGDGWCDDLNNNEDCDWDGGDCCESTCDPNAQWECGVDGYDCLDPDAPDFSSPTEGPYPDCEVDNDQWIGDGWCDPYPYNSEECGWDGGDCCPDTCTPTPFECCVNAPCECQDPDSDFGPVPPSPSPAPAPLPECPPAATVTGGDIPPYWANLATGVGLDLNVVGFNTICELWMYDNISTCIGWGEFVDHTCGAGKVCCGADGSYGTGISQVSHVADMVGLGDDQHYLCPLCPPPPPGRINKCHEGILYQFADGDVIPEDYEDPGSVSQIYPATWIECDCEMHHLGHHLIDQSYWWNQALLTIPPLDPAMVTFYDDAWGQAWYYNENPTCVGMGPWADMCSSMLYCAGDATPLPPEVGDKTLVYTYGSAAQQLGAVVDALYNGGVHSGCGYSFSEA